MGKHDQESERSADRHYRPTLTPTLQGQPDNYVQTPRNAGWFRRLQDHCSFFPGAKPIATHKDELKAYKTSKGTIRFPIGKPLPAALVKKLVKTRIAENEAAFNMKKKKR